MNYTAYLFDFDYTLADSSQGILICFRNVLDRRQFRDVTDEAIKRTIGKTLKESFSILTGITDPEQLASMQKEYSEEANIHMNANTVLFPATIAVLTRLKEQGARMGIVSTKFRFRIQNFLKDYFPDDFFDVIIGGEDVESHKPSPEGVFLALAQLGCSREETLYVGDSLVDAETAMEAGVDFAGVLTGMTTAGELRAFPHRVILTDLNDLLFPPTRKGWKSIYHRYFQLRKWVAFRRMIHIKQIRGRSISEAAPKETTICKNCGHTFTGNYCNHCAQSKEVQRFNFRSGILHALGGLSNIDRGFGYTLLELLYRPGYMINDFIAGKRVRYFRPFQTLFVLAAVYILLVQFIDPDALKKENTVKSTKQQEITDARDQLQMQLDTMQDETGKKVLEQAIKYLNRPVELESGQSGTQKSQPGHDGKENTEPSPDWIDNIVDNTAHISERKLIESPFMQRVWNILKNWAHGNKAVSIIFTLPLFALATRMAFRKRVYNRHYNYTEHIFVQTYIAGQILLVSSIYLLFRGKAEVGNLYDLSVLGIFVLFVWDYKQLFRGTWWQTIRRTMLMFFYSLLLIIFTAVILVTLLIGGLSLLELFGFGNGQWIMDNGQWTMDNG